MATLVCFHAHPDDEAISTGGSMARAATEGHRVVLVVATDGRHGEVPDDLGADDTLPERRRRETDVSAAALGVSRVEFLGYHDSGMTGWAANTHADSFWQADLDEAARRLATILIDERADVLTSYDWHGNYGHPDHIKIHQVVNRAKLLVSGELTQLRVFEATMNRDQMVRQIAVAREMGDGPFSPGSDGGEEFDPSGPMDDGNPMGTPESELTMMVDVSAYIANKREAIAAHVSQVSDSSLFLQMPPEMFANMFGTEWFIEHDVEPGLQPGWFFE
jgi:LmbE family N-acetylglucosaminyl deacetylase